MVLNGIKRQLNINPCYGIFIHFMEGYGQYYRCNLESDVISPIIVTYLFQAAFLRSSRALEERLIYH